MQHIDSKHHVARATDQGRNDDDRAPRSPVKVTKRVLLGFPPAQGRSTMRIPLMIATLTVLTTSASAGQLLISDELGVRLPVPPMADIMQRPGDGGSAFLLREKGSKPTWSLKVESVELEEPDASSSLRAILRDRLPEATAEAANITTIDLDGREAAQVWLTYTGPSGTPVVLGWLAAPQVLGHCLLLGAVTTPEAAARVQPLIQKSFTDSRLIDRANGNDRLRTDLDHGRDLLKSLSENSLRSLLGRHYVLRVFDPTGAEDREVAYGTLDVSEAPRSAVRSRPGPSSKAEEEEGLLVVTHLRFIENAEADIYIDRVQRCWVSWDLQRETWVDSTTRRDGKMRTGSMEVAIREPPSVTSPRGQLLIIRQDEAHGTRDTWTLVPTDPWLPRGLRWLVRDLLGPQSPRAFRVAYVGRNNHDPSHHDSPRCHRWPKRLLDLAWPRRAAHCLDCWCRWHLAASIPTGRNNYRAIR